MTKKIRQKTLATPLEFNLQLFSGHDGLCRIESFYVFQVHTLRLTVIFRWTKQNDLNSVLHCIRQQDINQWKVILGSAQKRKKKAAALLSVEKLQCRHPLNKLNNYLVACHLTERARDSRITHTYYVHTEANLFKVTMMDDVLP